MSDAQESVIRGYYHAAFGTGQPINAAIDQYMLADFVAHEVRLAHGGREGYGNFISMFAAAFSDMRHSICDIFTCDDRVAARWRWTGRHTAEFMGLPPTSRLVTLRGIDIFRVVDGKIAELWQEINVMDILQQIRAPQVSPHIERTI